MALAGCGAPRPNILPPATPLLSASLEQLVAGYNRNAQAIQTMSLKLVVTAHAGRHKYIGVNSYLLTARPADIRIWGTFTLVGRLFDMASDGDTFELSLPTTSQFFEGHNDVIPEKVKNPLEKIRPQIIRNALLINSIAPTARVALDPSAPENEYRVLVLAAAGDSTERILRSITFSRYDLQPHQQVIYDADGLHGTHATYDKYTVVAGIPVPTRMTIDRPIEGYALNLRVVRGGITLNRPFPDPHTFQLTPPAGSTVIHISPVLTH